MGLLKITLDMVVQLKFSKGYKLLSDCFIQFFQLYILITGFVTRLIRRVPLVEQELLILPEHPVFSGVRVTRSLVLCICFVDRCLFFFSFGNCVVCSYSIYGFGQPFGIFKLFLNWILIKLINYYHFRYSNFAVYWYSTSPLISWVSIF